MEQSEIKLFEGQNIRYVWDEGNEQYFFSVVDVIQVLTESTTPRRYWSDLKRKLAVEGSELYEKIVQLKLPSSDGKKYLTDVATTEQSMRPCCRTRYTLQVLNHCIRNLFVLCAYGNEQAEYNLGDAARIIA